MTAIDTLMYTDFTRIKSGELLNIQHRPYRLSYLEKMKTFFEEREEYENCIFLNRVIGDIKNHDGNYNKIKHTF